MENERETYLQDRPNNLLNRRWKLEPPDSYFLSSKFTSLIDQLSLTHLQINIALSITHRNRNLDILQPSTHITTTKTGSLTVPHLDLLSLGVRTSATNGDGQCLWGAVGNIAGLISHVRTDDIVEWHGVTPPIKIGSMHNSAVVVAWVGGIEGGGDFSIGLVGVGEEGATVDGSVDASADGLHLGRVGGSEGPGAGTEDIPCGWLGESSNAREGDDGSITSTSDSSPSAVLGVNRKGRGLVLGPTLLDIAGPVGREKG